MVVQASGQEEGLGEEMEAVCAFLKVDAGQNGRLYVCPLPSGLMPLVYVPR